MFGRPLKNIFHWCRREIPFVLLLFRFISSFKFSKSVEKARDCGTTNGSFETIGVVLPCVFVRREEMASNLYFLRVIVIV